MKNEVLKTVGCLMLVATASVAGAAGMSAANYVQEGLVVHFDGIDNAGWTVTLNGAAVSSVDVSGVNVTVKKDATGLWLKASKSGYPVVVR